MVDFFKSIFAKEPKKVLKTRYGVFLHGRWVYFDTHLVAKGMLGASDRPMQVQQVWVDEKKPKF